MDALKFLREVQRMHNYYTSIYHDCLKCPMADMPCRIPVTDWGGSVLNTCVERAEQVFLMIVLGPFVDTKKCLECNESYPLEYQYCPNDGTRLEE